MKNRWALRLAALTLVSCLAMSGVSLAVEPLSLIHISEPTRPY